jgi:uncharacterized protein YndB with AHSA1/START domain
MAAVHTTRAHRHFTASRASVYHALTHADAIAQWKFPAEMTCTVHSFDGREGGTFRVSLTYDAPDRAGKSGGRTDTYHGRFERLVPDELVVEVDEFESDDPALRGEMTLTITLTDADGGTDLDAVHAGLPDTVPAADNEAGWDQSLARLAALVE